MGRCEQVFSRRIYLFYPIEIACNYLFKGIVILTYSHISYVTIMATLLYHSAEHDKSRALKELIQRGIIRISDV